MHLPRYRSLGVHLQISENVLERARVGLLEFSLLITTFMLYMATRGIAAGHEAVAFGHAHSVMSLEQRVGLFREMGIQALLLAVPPFVHLLNFVYAYTHMTALMLFGLWVFLFHNERYRYVRNTFMTILIVGLAIYILYPLAPPRLFPYTGFVDTLKLYSGINYEQQSVSTLYNPFAAMPSLHVGFALFVGMGLIRIGKRAIYWIPGVLYPLLMATAVIGTANHYILDALAGSLLTIVAYLLVPRATDRYTAWLESRATRRMLAEPVD